MLDVNIVQLQDRYKGLSIESLKQEQSGPYGWLATAVLNEKVSADEQAKLAAGASKGNDPSVAQQVNQKAGLMGLAGSRVAQAGQQMADQSGAAPMPTSEMTPQPNPQPEPFTAARGGLANLPVNSRMFNYDGGGIVAFAEGEAVPYPEPVKIREAQLQAERKAQVARAARAATERAASNRDAERIPQDTPPAASGVDPAMKYASDLMAKFRGTSAEPSLEEMRGQKAEAFRAAGVPMDVRDTRNQDISAYEAESERMKKDREGSDLLKYIAGGMRGPGGMGLAYAAQQDANMAADSIRRDKAREMRAAMEQAARAEASGDVNALREAKATWSKANDEFSRAGITAATSLKTSGDTIGVQKESNAIQREHNRAMEKLQAMSNSIQAASANRPSDLQKVTADLMAADKTLSRIDAMSKAAQIMQSGKFETADVARQKAYLTHMQKELETANMFLLGTTPGTKEHTEAQTKYDTAFARAKQLFDSSSPASGGLKSLPAAQPAPTQQPAWGAAKTVKP
jgi:hypothetical protein